MGLRHSKPKQTPQRSSSKRFNTKRGSSGRRQSPEGGNQSPTVVSESKVENIKPASTTTAGLCTGTCPCTSSSSRLNNNNDLKTINAIDSNKENRLSTTTMPTTIRCDTDGAFSCNNSYRVKQQDQPLKVDLPPPSSSSSHHHHLHQEIVDHHHQDHHQDIINSRGRPMQRNSSRVKLNIAGVGEQHEETEVTTTTEETSEWSFTIPQIDCSSTVDREERISLLMSSIREEVVSRLDEIHHSARKSADVRLRLSLTPEPRSTMCCHRDDSLVTRAMESRRNCCKSKSEGTTPIRYRACSRDENHDRRRYYRQIPGNDSEKASSLYKRSLITRSGESRSRSRDTKSHHCTNRCRHNHSRDSKDRNNKHQTAYDQSFQETMVLRLRELQRNTEKLARRANGDAADDESLTSGSGSTSESEYSGADDGNSVRPVTGDPGVSRLYQPISDRDMEALGVHEGPDYLEQSLMQRHNQTSSMRASSGRIIESASVATATRDKSKTRKKRKKRLKNDVAITSSTNNNITSSSKHGYLRANAIKSGAICSLPPTAKSTLNVQQQQNSLVSKSLTVGDGVTTSPTTGGMTTKSSVIRHQHEHIHHHYYYPCKPDT